MGFLTDGISPDEIPLIAHIFDKIYTMLPIESDIPLNEVENEKTFLESRKALINMAPSSIFNDIITYSIIILDKINHLDNFVAIKQRDIQSLQSVLIVLRLLADLSKVNWDSKEPPTSAERKNSVNSNFSVNSSASSMNSNAVGIAVNVDYHSVQPDPLKGHAVIKAIALISRLKSVNNLTLELAKLNGKTPMQLHHDDSSSTASNSTGISSAKKMLVDQIDLNCEAILRFLAAANPSDFFEFTVSKLNALKHNISNDGEFAPYLELISSTYLNERYLLDYLKHLRVIMNTIKKAAYRQLVLSFFMKAMTIWIYARPHEYLNCARSDSAVAMEAESLFDELISLPDSPVSSRLPNQFNSRQYKPSYKFLAFLMSLYPRCFQQFQNSSNTPGEKNVIKKLTPSFNVNRKQKLLSSVNKVLSQTMSKDASENITVLETLDFIVAIATVASSIYSLDPQNIVVKYSLSNYEMVARALVPITSSKRSPLIYMPSPMESNLLTELRLEYFSSICVLNSREVIPRLVTILNDEQSPLETLHIAMSILRIFTGSPTSKNSNQNLVYSILPCLRKVMDRMSRLIKNTAYVGDDVSISSGASSYSTSNTGNGTQSSFPLGAAATAASTTPPPMSVESSKHTSSNSTVSNIIIPRGDKLKETTKNLFRGHHHGSSQHHSHSGSGSGSGSGSLSQRQELLTQAHLNNSNGSEGPVVTASPSSSYIADDEESKSSDSKEHKISHYSREILINALSIFSKIPHAYFYTFADPETTVRARVDILMGLERELVDPILISLLDNHPRLSAAVRDFLLSFISVTSIPDDPQNTVACHVGIALTLKSFAQFLTNFNYITKESLELFVRMFEYRVSLYSLLANHRYFEELRDYEPYYVDAGSKVEEAMLTALCLPDLESYGWLVRAIACLEAELTKNASRTDRLRDFFNRNFYAVVTGTNILRTGRVALQKIVRKNFLKIDIPTKALITVWNHIFDEWFHLARSDYSEMTSQELTNFRNFAGFLAATSGILVGVDSPKHIEAQFKNKVEVFVKQQLEMLHEQSLVTRENAKEILSSEMNPKAFPVVIKFVKPIIGSFCKTASVLSVGDLTVIEMLITLLKNIVDCPDDLIVFSVSIDLIECADLLAKTVDSIAKIDTNILKLRIRLSTMFQRIEANSEKLIIKSSYKIRNGFLRYVYNWFDQSVAYDAAWHSRVDDLSNNNNFGHDPVVRPASNSISNPTPNSNSNSSATLTASNAASNHVAPITSGGVGSSQTNPGDYEYLYLDVAIESAKALSCLLNELTLEAPQVINEKELKSSKASIFSVYFNTFLKAMERYTDIEKYPLAIRHKVSMISDSIVLCLTNLLKSNVDVGLSYALPIGYYTNLSIRTSFLKVFVSIVESYSKPTALSADELMKEKAIEIFRECVENTRLLSAIGRACPISDAANLASCAQSIADKCNQSAQMVSVLIEEEIMYGNNYADILRRNSFASRALSAFGRTKGHDFLVETLRPILTEIRDSELDLEVEKTDLENPQAGQILNNFIHYLKKLVNVIINSAHLFPIEFRYVCKTISDSVKEKFPDYRLIAVGSFIFLRFFCPVIVSPESEKIVDIPNRQTQRKFLLLAKVLQNMANGGSIGSLRWPLLKQKEDELNLLNDKILKFLDEVTILDQPVTFEFKIKGDIPDTDFNLFHTFTYSNWSRVRAEFIKSCESKEDLENARTFALKCADYLKIVGQPTVIFGYEMPASISPENNFELYEFMSKYTFKDISGIAECPFIHQAIAQDGTHLLVFSYSEYKKIGELDQDLAIFRIFQVASKVWEQKYNFIIDCTGNNGQVVFPRRALTLMSNIAPEEMKTNCMGIYYYNISSTLYPVVKYMFRNNNIMDNSLTQHYYFPSARDDKKSIVNLGLSNSSLRSYNDTRVKFLDVSLYQESQKRFVPVMLKIGNEALQVSQNTPQRLKVLSSLKEIYLNDVYQLEDIDRVEATAVTGVPNELTIFFKDDTKVVLASKKFLEIMRLLYFTKKRTLGISSAERGKEESEKTVYDMLGQLVNVILLGLTSSAEEVRSISYNLLAASLKHFNLDLARDLEQFPEVYFPGDNNSFVISISERLAETVPHITGEFITAFFKVYNDTITPRQRLSAILYVSPWISNIYDYVYTEDSENGADFVAEIIRNFLTISKLDPVFLSAFNLSIWSKLCLEDRLCPILVNEIVLTAIDREAEGTDWKSAISLLTSTPTVELCGHVIKRLREIAHIPFPNAEGKYSVESHSNWIEITVLVQISVSLFFDSLMFAEMFLPDIFYIVTVLVDVGPLDLRIASHQLLLNVLQSFLTKPRLPEESKAKVRAIVEHFSSHRSRILFGLNRDNSDSFPTEISKFSSRVSTMESLVASLLEIIEVTSLVEEKHIWLTRWNRYVIDAACRKDSVLRGRALLLLGVLAKSGMNDNIVTKVLEMVSEVSVNTTENTKSLYLSICAIFSMGKISEGLLPESAYFYAMFWLSVVISRSKQSAIYQGGVQFLVSILRSMERKDKFAGGDMISILIDSKKAFGALLQEVEGSSNLVLTKDNFDQMLLYFAVRGLQLTYAKNSSVMALKAFFKLLYKNELANTPSTGGAPRVGKKCFGFLLFLNMLLRMDEFEDFLVECGLDSSFVEIGDDVCISCDLLEYLLADTDNSNLSLYQLALYFNFGGPNDRTKHRILILLKFIGQRNIHLLLKVYYEIRPGLRRNIGGLTSSDTLLTDVFSLASIATVALNAVSNSSKYVDITEALLDKYQLGGIRSHNFPDNADFSDVSNAAVSSSTSVVPGIIAAAVENRIPAGHTS
ncbi:hypothetical protein WICPIJ_002169 [Wickerhamomyces pijperi]|uniref:Ras-GAP domain-containing protein n=1 Tax=Wickerhamomyces pijperi TaxID=599730 RepID=A0A9P8QA75_WICPI|nr:hypothetical protein WICPIJ_002169 [Wickerhamomyces pijperi]